MKDVKSIRYTFAWQENELKLVKAEPCLALSLPSDDISEREGVTGTWVELTDESGRVLYRHGIYALFHAVSSNGFQEMDECSVLMPYLPQAKTISVYAPPREENGAQTVFGDTSTVIAEYPVPEPVILDINEEPVLPYDICGQGRGTVLYKRQIIHGGPVEDVYNFIILADKFGSSQDVFERTAFSCLNFLYSRPPFNTTAGHDSMNVWLVGVESKNKNPSYFNTKYSLLDTHIEWETANVTKVCNALFSKDGKTYWHWAGIIINEKWSDIGTRRGSQFAIGLFNLLTSPQTTFQHEFGHAAFNLGDEYGNSGTYPYTTNDRPNLTTETNREKLPWSKYVVAETPIPTDDSYYKKHKADVGLYKGGGTYKYGIYRPQYVCVMRNQDKSGVNGYFCRVCTDVATKIMYKALSVYIPVPSIMYYSNNDKKWSNITVAGKIDQKHGSISNYDGFDELILELQAARVSVKINDIMSRIAKVSVGASTTVINTNEDGSGTRGLWYLIPPKGEVMYYILTYKTDHGNEVSIGSVKLPKFPELSFFEGVTVGVEQHIFCISDGKLSYGKMNASGEIGDNFKEQTVKGLDTNINTVSADYKSARIFVAVTNYQSVKIGAYSIVSQSWDENGFIELDYADEDISYEFVKIVQIDARIYVLVKTSEGLLFSIFNTTFMKWETDQTNPLENTADAIQADISYYQNTMWFTIVTPETTEVISYDLLKKQVIKQKPMHSANEESTTEIITSFGTTVQGTTLHRIYITCQKAVHETLEIYFDYTENIYKLKFLEKKFIDILNDPQKKIGGISTHNNGKLIYLIVSDNAQLSETKSHRLDYK